MLQELRHGRRELEVVSNTKPLHMCAEALARESKMRSEKTNAAATYRVMSGLGSLALLRTCSWLAAEGPEPR